MYKFSTGEVQKNWTWEHNSGNFSEEVTVNSFPPIFATDTWLMGGGGGVDIVMIEHCRESSASNIQTKGFSKLAQHLRCIARNTVATASTVPHCPCCPPHLSMTLLPPPTCLLSCPLAERSGTAAYRGSLRAVVMAGDGEEKSRCHGNRGRGREWQ